MSKHPSDAATGWAVCFGAIALYLNPWTAGWMHAPDGVIGSWEKRLGLLAIQIFFFVLSYWCWKGNAFPVSLLRNSFIQNILLLGLTVTGAGFTLELVLKTGLFDQVEDPRPVWIPPKYKTMEDSINRENLKIASRHPYSFTDSVRQVTKPDNTRRIAILGDSFIWGDAVPYDDIWSHRLEGLINREHPHVEVHSWGGNSWSTKRQLQFLQEHGYKYRPDLLIVGYVANDPDEGLVVRKNFTWQKSIALAPVRFLFPVLFHFTASYVNNAMQRLVYRDHGYAYWERQLYTPENLKAYQHTLMKFKAFCDSTNIDLLFVLTPSNNIPYYGEIFEKVIPYLEEANISHFNLQPLVAEKFEGVNPRSLWATPANAHPGKRLTSFFAEEVYRYLKKEKPHFFAD